VNRPIIQGRIPPERLAAMSGRLDQALAVGNEGAGTVIAAGSEATSLIGRVVAIRATTGAYARHQIIEAADCLVLPEGLSARDGAAAFINPLSALGMVETMRREGHSALVHTAAASNLGQMLVRLCRKDGVPLVNIVRSATQVSLLRDLGAEYVVDSSAPEFVNALAAAIESAGATLAFDAIGGGTMASTLLSAMEAVQIRKLPPTAATARRCTSRSTFTAFFDPASQSTRWPVRRGLERRRLAHELVVQQDRERRCCTAAAAGGGRTDDDICQPIHRGAQPTASAVPGSDTRILSPRHRR